MSSTEKSEDVAYARLKVKNSEQESTVRLKILKLQIYWWSERLLIRKLRVFPIRKTCLCFKPSEPKEK